MTDYELLGASTGNELAAIGLKIIRASQGRCTGETWDTWLNWRITAMQDELRRNAGH